MFRFLANRSLMGLLAGSFLGCGIVFAVPTIDGDVNEDLYFPSGVLILGVEMPDNSVKTTGSSMVTVSGVGTVTVGNQAGGGFPRITILGGTTITSTRTWSEEDALRISWWEGQFSSPSSTRSPNVDDVDYPNIGIGSELQVAAAYSFGLTNESFMFSPAATVAFPVTESDGKQLWIAEQKDDSWHIDQSKSCTVQDQLCIVEIDTASSIALVRELYGNCPISSVTNGTVSSPPHCEISCHNGYVLDDAGKACIIFDAASTTDNTLKDSAYRMAERPQYSTPQGYYRYLGTREPERRILDDSLMEPAQAERARHLNRSFWGRNPKSTEEQTYQPEPEVTETPAQRDSFLNYVQEMRNKFGAGSSPNTLDSLTPTEVSQTEENNTDDEVEATDEYHSSGTPLLPSTGPELFVVIALIGLFMMIVAARRKG